MIKINKLKPTLQKLLKYWLVCILSNALSKSRGLVLCFVFFLLHKEIHLQLSPMDTDGGHSERALTKNGCLINNYIWILICLVWPCVTLILERHFIVPNPFFFPIKHESKPSGLRSGFWEGHSKGSTSAWAVLKSLGCVASLSCIHFPINLWRITGLFSCPNLPSFCYSSHAVTYCAWLLEVSTFDLSWTHLLPITIQHLYDN